MLLIPLLQLHHPEYLFINTILSYHAIPAICHPEEVILPWHADGFAILLLVPDKHVAVK